MSKIVTKGRCNFIESAGINSGSFLGDLISECPTYKEITEIDKFNITGTYEYNQLVKESDITKYTGKPKNYSYIWAEWDLNTYTGQASASGIILNMKFKQNFLYAPDTNLKIVINFSLFTEGNTSTGTIPGFTQKSLTVNFTQSTGSDKKYAYTQNYFTTFNTMFTSISIDKVTITPVNGTSQYEYVTIKKDVTLNSFVKTFSVASTSFYINSYNDDTTNKIITNQCKIIPKFAIPTGASINNIVIYADEKNFSDASSVEITYSPTNNSLEYTFKVFDSYGERGYKLPYFYTKFVLEQKNTTNKSYVYALWNPSSSNTGIELTSLILDE